MSNEKIPTVGGSSESREELQPAIQTLKEVAERFRALDYEAQALLLNRDTKGYPEKLRERAGLIVDLPNRLAGSLEGVDRETKERISNEVFHFSISAREALESGGIFTLNVLLTDQDGKIGEKNDLEKLIESLESK